MWFISVLEKSPLGAIRSTIRTFLPDQSLGTIRPFLLFCAQNFSQFLGWKNAAAPHLIDSDGRPFYKDSKYGPNSKIMKSTKRSFLQTTAEWWFTSLSVKANKPLFYSLYTANKTTCKNIQALFIVQVPQKFRNFAHTVYFHPPSHCTYLWQ